MNKLITLTLMLGMTVSFSQEKLRLSEALAIALKNNIDIQIERNNHESNDEQVKIQFDSFLPKFNIRTGLSYQNESQANFVGTINVGNRTTDTTTYNAGLGINLQVNDIYGTVLSYVRALEVNDQSSENKTRNIQQIIKNVTNNFFNLAKQVALQQVRENAVKTNEQQVERAKSRFDIGSAAKKDIFTARVQLNNSKTALIQQKLQVEQAKNTLNIALGRNPYEAIEADIGSDLIANKYNNFEEIETEMLDKNPDLKSSRLSVDIAKTDLQRAANALYLPKVNVSAGYNKSVNFEGELNNTLSRLFDTGTDYSWSASLGLSYNFGMSSIYQNEQAEIGKMNADLNLVKKERELKATIRQAFITYQNQKEIVKILEENLEAAREDLRLAQERFNLGSGTSLELRQAQDDLTSAESNLVSAKYDAKIAEVEIDRLLGLMSIE